MTKKTIDLRRINEHCVNNKMMEAVNSGKEEILNMPVRDLIKKYQKTYGRFADGVKVINPRQQ